MGCIKSSQRLSAEDLDFLKAHTRYDENTIKEWYNGFKQDYPNGRLTPVQFINTYNMFFPNRNAEQFCDHVFKTFDSDKKGYITFEAFLWAIDCRTQQPQLAGIRRNYRRKPQTGIYNERCHVRGILLRPSNQNR